MKAGKLKTCLYNTRMKSSCLKSEACLLVNKQGEIIASGYTDSIRNCRSNGQCYISKFSDKSIIKCIKTSAESECTSEVEYLKSINYFKPTQYAAICTSVPSLFDISQLINLGVEEIFYIDGKIPESVNKIESAKNKLKKWEFKDNDDFKFG